MPRMGLGFVWLLVDLLLRVGETSQGAALSEPTPGTFTVLCWGKGLPGLGAGDAEGDHPV